MIAELEAAAVADLQITDTVQPRGLILLEAACWAEVHTENHGSGGRPHMPDAMRWSPAVSCGE